MTDDRCFCPVTRRAFLRSGALALVSLGLDPLFLGRAAFARDASPAGRGRILVCLFQRGAVDGLSMVIPHGDGQYYSARPRIGIPASEVLDLDGHFGLHPALGGLMPLWREGTLAIVHAVGSPDITRSHFDAQDYMESGTPGIKGTRDGWLNRHAQHAAEHRDTPFQSVAFGPQLPRILAGSAPALAISDLRSFGLTTKREGARDRLTRAFEETVRGFGHRNRRVLGRGRIRGGANTAKDQRRRIPSGQRRRVSQREAGPFASRDRAADQGGRRAGERVRGRRRMGHAHRAGRKPGTARRPASRSGRLARRIRARPGRSNAGRGGAHHVGVWPDNFGEWKRRDRSRPRHGDVRAGWRRPRRSPRRALAGPGARRPLPGSRSRRDHGFSRPLRRSSRAPCRSHKSRRGVSRLRRRPGAIPGNLPGLVGRARWRDFE